MNQMNQTNPDSIDNLILNENQLPPFDLVIRCYLNYYLKKLNRHMLPKSRWKYLVMVVELFHLLIGTGAFTLGLLLPPSWLPYNILLVAVVIIGWELLGYCFVTKLVSKFTGQSEMNGDLSNQKNNRFLIPFSATFLKLYGFLVIGLSIFFHLKPQWAPFTFAKTIVLFLLKWGMKFLTKVVK